MSQTRNAAATTGRPTTPICRCHLSSPCVGAALALPYPTPRRCRSTSTKSRATSPKGAHLVLRLDRARWHTARNLDVPKNFTPIFLPPRASELNQSRTSGSIFAQTGSPTASSTPTTLSTTPAARPGGNSSQKPKPSLQSACANGLTSVNRRGLCQSVAIGKPKLSTQLIACKVIDITHALCDGRGGAQ